MVRQSSEAMNTIIADQDVLESSAELMAVSQKV